MSWELRALVDVAAGLFWARTLVVVWLRPASRWRLGGRMRALINGSRPPAWCTTATRTTNPAGSRLGGPRPHRRVRRLGFGSVGRGEQDGESDLDLMMDIEPGHAGGHVGHARTASTVTVLRGATTVKRAFQTGPYSQGNPDLA